MSLIEYARKELEIAGLFDKDSDYGGMLAEAVMELMEVFAGQGHSGFSAAQVRMIFHRLSDFKPLTPIIDEPDQWMDVGEGEYQHKRYGSVFKHADGQAHDIDAVVFRDKYGVCWQRRESRRLVVFPYTVPDRPEVLPAPQEDEGGDHA